MTAPYGLLGHHLTHSYSPLIHKALAGYDYALFEIAPDDLEAFFRERPFRGINVTIPHKKAVIPYLDALSPAAKAIGSVNTILHRADGSLFGDNTDVIGFAQMAARSGITLEGKKVLVLGSGGASLAVCHVLGEQGAREVLVISRSGAHNYENLRLHADAQVIINTTPVGMYPNVGVSPVDLDLFPRLEGVLDLIYNPARPRLILDAEERGIKACSGLPMLVWQAKAAAERFTGKPIEEARAETVLQILRRKTENVVLIGMPGCGKTTIGTKLAKLVGLQFVDADHYIEQQAGCTIPEIFEREGEDGFRKWETQALEKLGKESGLLIATGGGCVTRQGNYPLLRQNGTIVFLERPVEELETEGRPLSRKDSLDQMYRDRKPLYRRFADIRVKNDAAPEQVAARMMELIYETVGD